MGFNGFLIGVPLNYESNYVHQSLRKGNSLQSLLQWYSVNALFFDGQIFTYLLLCVDIDEMYVQITMVPQSKACEVCKKTILSLSQLSVCSLSLATACQKNLSYLRAVII